MAIFRIAVLVAALQMSAAIYDEARTQTTSMLLDAVARGDKSTVTTLIGQPPSIDIETRDRQGRTALLIATYRNDIEMAKLLIAAGADVNAKDDLSDSPFLYAAAEGRLEILRLTLPAGADLTSLNRFGGTGLIPAAHHGYVDNVRELVKTHISVDHINNLGWTALLEAIILGDGGPAHTEIVRLLVEAGADVNLADGQGVRPLAHAEARNQAQISGILRNAGAN